MLLLAAATETGLLTQLEKALPRETIPTRPPLAGSSAVVRRRLLLTLLFLGAVGLHRTWDLRSYTGKSLARLSGRKRAYGYSYTEAFLSQIARAGCAEGLTDALARWTTDLWHPEIKGDEQPRSLTCYIDGHRKPVYSDVLIPRGLIGRLGVILGCRALVLLHDDQGHPLLATTHRGDQHLTVGLPAIVSRYEQVEKQTQINQIIVDREGMAVEFLTCLQEAGRAVVTVLRTDQYRDLTSFTDVGAFVPFRVDAEARVIREVASARIAFPRPEHPGEVLSLQVALIRDLRRTVEVQPDPEDAGQPQRWDADRKPGELRWTQEGWQATPAPATPVTPKLIPIVSTAATADAVELAQTYIRRWSVQENVIKDYLLPLGLDTNHGYGKTAVENSEVARQRSKLEKRLARLQQWTRSASQRRQQAYDQAERLSVKLESRRQKLLQQMGWDETGPTLSNEADPLERQKIEECFTKLEVVIRPIAHQIYRSQKLCQQEGDKQERYSKEQREVLRALEDLAAKERTMYELDHRKDQVMTVCKVALANLAMWVRDQYFPASYAHATWRRLLPFFQLPGTITRDATTTQVELSLFNDRALNRDLAFLCERVNKASPRLPDGRLLSFTRRSTRCVLPAQNVARIT